MALRAGTIRKAEIARAIDAARHAGLVVAECIVTRDQVRIITPDGAAARPAPAANPWDRVLTDGAAE